MFRLRQEQLDNFAVKQLTFFIRQLCNLTRQFFSKGSDFSRIGRQAVGRAAFLLNHWFRKRLRFRTPAHVFARISSVALQL